MFIRIAILMSFALAQVIPAQAEVVGEVIAAQLYYSPGNTALLSAANGGQYAEAPCGSDLTHGGSPRYFLDQVASGYTLPDTYQGSNLFVADEGCEQPVFITNANDMRFSTTPHWSPDDTRIAVYAERWDLAGGVLAERGVFVMDVVFDGAGRPVGTENLRLVIPLQGEKIFGWSGDGEWLVYSDSAPDGAGGEQSDLFLFDLVTETGFNLTDSAGISEMTPTFSPVDNRIAYVTLSLNRGQARWDVFTIDAVTRNVVQVTNKKTTGSPGNRFPAFSPDGQYISFSSGSVSGPIMPFDIYKIRSDGSGKAINLTAKREGDFRYHVWRR